MKSAKEPEPVEVFSGNNWEAGFIKSLLENAEIQAFMIDGIIGTEKILKGLRFQLSLE